ASRQLAAKQNQLLSLMRGTQNGEGQREILPHQADQIRSLEGDCVKLTDAVNALKLDYIQAKTEEDLNRTAREPLHSPGIFAGAGGEAAQAEAVKAAGRMRDSLGDAFVESAGYKKWLHGGQAQACHIEVPTLGARHWAMKSAADAMKTTLTAST